ncbi:hypothetical protein T10_2477 [Trichinella papuae]|uniref:Uncharacterized protein n=1 Tax=Trichinella papuae TaxID=268474 RepID=A0A0V1N0H8_9BILA|nr:hypothetical protein T10_2477 [Trichinella papuae]
MSCSSWCNSRKPYSTVKIDGMRHIFRPNFQSFYSVLPGCCSVRIRAGSLISVAKQPSGVDIRPPLKVKSLTLPSMYRLPGFASYFQRMPMPLNERVSTSSARILGGAKQLRRGWRGHIRLSAVHQSLQSVLTLRPLSRFDEDIQGKKEKQSQCNRLKCLFERATDNHRHKSHRSRPPTEHPAPTPTKSLFMPTNYRNLSDDQVSHHSFYRSVARSSCGAMPGIDYV